MGIVNCADEHIGTLPNDPKLDLHLGKEHPNSIYCLSMHVLKEAQESGRTTQQVCLFSVVLRPRLTDTYRSRWKWLSSGRLKSIHSMDTVGSKSLMLWLKKTSGRE
jgi:hypothetical protein